MKRLRKLMVCVMAMVMALSVTTTAFASQSSELAEWRGFPSQKKSSYSSAYTKAVQRFLYDYNETTRQLIVDSGGCDGSFGSGTDTALRAYQSARGLSVDGSCGPATWGDFYNTLNYSGRQYIYVENDGYYYAYAKTVGYQNIMVRKGSVSGYWYIRTSNSSGTTSATSGTYQVFDK